MGKYSLCGFYVLFLSLTIFPTLIIACPLQLWYYYHEKCPRCCETAVKVADTIMATACHKFNDENNSGHISILRVYSSGSVHPQTH